MQSKDKGASRRPSFGQLSANNLSAAGMDGSVPLTGTKATVYTLLNPTDQYFKLDSPSFALRGEGK